MPNHQKNETRWSHVLEVRPCHNTPSRFTRALADIGAGEIGVTQLEEDLWTTKADSRSCTSGERLNINVCALGDLKSIGSPRSLKHQVFDERDLIKEETVTNHMAWTALRRPSEKSAHKPNP